MEDFHLNENEFIESTEPSNLEEYSTEESNHDGTDDDDEEEVEDDDDNDEDEEFDDNGYDNDEYNSESEEFYFESDHLALRGNPDYRAVLRTIVVLESQRIEVAKHIDKIADMKRTALQNPMEFIKKLTTGYGLDISGPINIQNVSKKTEVLIAKFNPKVNFQFLILQFCVLQLPKIKLEKYNVSFPTLRTNINTNATNNAKDENDYTVRGRTFDQTKPVTFNQVTFSIYSYSVLTLILIPF